MTTQNTDLPLCQIPRVDAHMHVRERDAIGQLIECTNKSGINVNIGLSPSKEMIAETEAIFRETNGAILNVPGQYWIHDGLWWTKDDLDMFKEVGCPGTKILSKYQEGLCSKEIMDKLAYQAEIGLDVVYIHVVDPPRPGFWEDNFWECIAEAETLIRENPELKIIMAHGFWLMVENKGLDVLEGYFETYPHLYVDLSATYQWWHPEPDYERLRNFVIKFKNRLLYGTDSNPKYAERKYYERSYRVLETADEGLSGFFGERANLKGLELPADVLNHIYYWNAAQLMPRVQEALELQGVCSTKGLQS